MFDYSDEFLIIRQYQSNDRLCICWLSESQSMSRLEFKNAIDIILATVTATQAVKVLIDALDFNYPIIKEETMRLIRYALLSPSSVEHYALVDSHCFYGMITIEIIMDRIDDIGLNIIRFDERSEGLNWLFGE